MFRLRVLFLAALAASTVWWAWARPDASLSSMYVDGKMLEVVDCRQLTLKKDGLCGYATVSPNGKYAACLRSDPAGVQIVDVASRRSVLALDRSALHDVFANKAKLTEPVWTVAGMFYNQFCWLSSSREFAVLGDHFLPDDKGGYQEESAVFVMNLKGTIRLSYPIAKGAMLDQIIADPYGIRLALLIYTPESETKKTVVMWDTRDGSADTIITSKKGDLEIIRWTPMGDALLCRTSEAARARQLVQVDVADKTQKNVPSAAMRGFDSPNMRLFASENDSGIEVKSHATGEVVRKVAVKGASFGGWVPGSKLFMYWTATPVADETKTRGGALRQLWLASLENHKVNHLCIASSADYPMQISMGPTWSKDQTCVVYTNEGQVYAAELTWRTADANDKLVVGLDLAEEEEKQLISAQAKEIGTSIMMYAADWDDKFPPGEKIEEELYPYFRDKDLMKRPGKDDIIFKYHRPGDTQGSVEHAADTVIGEMDAGYSWIVKLYADGHVAVSQK